MRYLHSHDSGIVIIYSNTTTDKVLEEELEFTTFEGLVLRGYKDG